MPPTVAQLVDLVVHLEDDPARRHVLDGRSYDFFRAAVEDGLVSHDEMDEFAVVVGQAIQQHVLGFRTQHAGAILPPPEALWTPHAFQSRGGYYATLDGQQMAALYRQRRPATTASEATHRSETARSGAGDRDLFVSHASEDKQTVARPLAQALMARGWTVWLDELELTIGDSLSGRIEAALARSRFGVVILSPSSFAKEWPQRELAGLAAREVDAGTKVILPVWHEVDHHYVAARAPILADRLGAHTTRGIEDVAEKISAALERAGMQTLTGLPPAPVLQSVEHDEISARLTIPASHDDQTSLIVERPDWWEHRLFAGKLLQGKRDLETKWDDHRLRMPRGSRREVDQEHALDFLGREIGWVRKQAGLLDRILDPSLQEQAFGPKGKHGDPARINAFADRIVKLYESLLDWAAALRATAVPDDFEEAFEATACLVDAAIASIRQFIETAVDQIERLPELAADGTEEQPIRIYLDLRLAVNPVAQRRHTEALDALSKKFGAT